MKIRNRTAAPSIGIIGAGPGGMALGILLKRAGFKNFTIFDREDGVGGTWRVNTYPGLACDVKSHLYSFSFYRNPNWSRLWAAQPEILQYFERAATKFKLQNHLVLGTEISSATWNEKSNNWSMRTTAGEEHTFDYVVSAVGIFNQPIMPRLSGADHFGGTIVHSSRWNESVAVDGANVAVLGTGSTASQLVPAIANRAKNVYSVQRSATWVLPKPDRPYTDRERWVFAHVPFATKAYRTRLWFKSEAQISGIHTASEKTEERRQIALNFLEKTVADPDLREKLTPQHTIGCKRLVFSSDFIPSLTASNVEVVTNPVVRLTDTSLVTEDGTERPVDLVVCATGYAAADYLGEIEVTGEGGLRLGDVWQDGAYAYLGMAVPRFPNLFMLYGPNTNVGSNSVLFVLEAQARYVVRALTHLRRRRSSYIGVKASAADDFLAKVDTWMEGTVWTTQCSNYFRGENGRVVTQWPRSARDFWMMVRRFRSADYDFEPAPAGVNRQVVTAKGDRHVGVEG